MAKRKQDLYMNDFSGVSAVDLKNPNTLERKVLTNVIKSQKDVANSQLVRLSSVSTEVTYFHQISDDKNDYLVNINPLNNIDPNLRTYAKVSNFILNMGQLDPDVEELEGGTKSVEGNGVVFILPNTILPLANDFFTCTFRDRLCLFRITEVKPLVHDKDTAYECQYELHQEYFNYEDSELKDSVSTEYVFIQSYVGTEYRTVFKVDEYNTLIKLQNMYNELGSVYYEQFWDKVLGTYILKYSAEPYHVYDRFNNFVKITEKGINMPQGFVKNQTLEDIIDEKRGFYERPILTPIKVNTGHKESIRFIDLQQHIALHQGMLYNEGVVTKAIKNEMTENAISSSFDGVQMYDGELIEFIRRNNIFITCENTINLPQQYFKNRKKDVYNYTIFNAMELRSSHRFRNAFMLPVMVDTASPASIPVLYGKANLIHVPSCNEQCLNMFPNYIYDKINLNQALDINADDIAKDISIIERIINIVSLFINKKDKHILNQILYLYNNIDEMHDQIRSDNYIFYIFPLLGYIIKYFSDKLSSRDYAAGNIANPVDKR